MELSKSDWDSLKLEGIAECARWPDIVETKRFMERLYIAAEARSAQRAFRDELPFYLDDPNSEGISEN
jgi:hypothetical protein